MQRTPSQSQQILERAFAAHQSGNLGQAEFLYRLVLDADRRQFDALHMLGIIEAQRGNLAAGLDRLRQALRIRPGSLEVMINLGRMQSELGRYADAAETYERALRVDPGSALAHSNFSIVLRKQGHADAALAHCDAALASAPNFAEGWCNRGNSLFDLKRYGEALQCYDRALSLVPALGAAHLGRGNALAQEQNYDAALVAYDRALAAGANPAEAHFGRGNVLSGLFRLDDALAAYDAALSARPDYAESYLARGTIHKRLGNHTLANADFARACGIESGLAYAEGARLGGKLDVCDWDGLEADSERVLAAVRQRSPALDPFQMLALSDSPADQRACAEVWMERREPVARAPLWRGEIYSHDRIRVAYVSADFREHATGYLLAGLFEHHDRSRFEVTGISFGPSANSPMRERIAAAFERFIDVRHDSDQTVAELVRRLEIDLAVDLMGHTLDARVGIFARRPAPVQVSYLGFLGTTGAGFMDYLIADEIVVPHDQEIHYSEKIVCLPDCFLVNDDRLAIAERAPTRAEAGLPEDGFVFCSFNNSYKLRLPVFEAWMRLLRAVDGSVLWLLQSNTEMVGNLKQQAQRCGIDPERLIFAPRIDFAGHLARQRLAGLFLDTLPYNAGATAAAALWSGVPVLTVLGETFVGRMAASMLHAVGLPELVTASLTEYEALAAKIALEPRFRAVLNDALARNRESFPLFDTKRFARHIEAAYTQMWQHYQRGEAPEHFAVGANPRA